MLLVTIDVVLDALVVRDVLKAILSSIFFYRVFGVARPVSPPRDVLDITYPAVDDRALDALIDERTAQLVASLTHRPPPPSHAPDPVPMDEMDIQHETVSAPSLGSLNLSAGSAKSSQINVSFYEKKTVKAWFSKSEAEVCWEQWLVNVAAVSPRNEAERARVAKAAETQLQTIMLRLVDIANDHKAHIPPIAAGSDNPFPYQITVPAEPQESWGSVFKKILVES